MLQLEHVAEPAKLYLPGGHDCASARVLPAGHMNPALDCAHKIAPTQSHTGVNLLATASNSQGLLTPQHHRDKENDKKMS